MNWRRIRKWCLSFAAVLSVVLLVATWFVGGALVAPANRTVGLPPANFPATSVEIESDSGATLAGWHLPLADSKATVILLHPIRGDRRSMLARARLFRKHGYSTLLIDLQAHGESTGENITLGFREKHDVIAAVEFVREEDPGGKIAIVGRSLGGASTLFANPAVDVIVLESVYSTVSKAVHNRVEMRLGFLHHVVAPLLLVQLNPRLGISPKELCPIDQLKNVRCPVVITVGGHDQHTTLDESRQMFEAANEPKKLVVFEGAGHVDLLDFDAGKYEKEVVESVEQVIND